MNVLFIYQQDEQTGAVMDPASSNPYNMSIEEYFNPSSEPNTRGRARNRIFYYS